MRLSLLLVAVLVLCVLDTTLALSAAKFTKIQGRLGAARAKSTVHEAEELFLHHTAQGRAEELAQTHALNSEYYFILADAGSGGTRPYVYYAKTTAVAPYTMTVHKGLHCILANGGKPKAMSQVTPVGGLYDATAFLTDIQTSCAISAEVASGGVALGAPPNPTLADVSNGVAVGFALVKAKINAGAGLNANAKAIAFVKTLPVFIQATAGLRGMPEAARNTMLQDINGAVMPGTAIKPRASIISGRWEGFYGFFAAMVSAPALIAAGSEGEFIYVEIGGASIQVVFTVPDANYVAVKGVAAANNVLLEQEAKLHKHGQPVLLELQGPMKLTKFTPVPANIRTLYSQSFLGNAGDRIHARAVRYALFTPPVGNDYTSPCLPKDTALVDHNMGANFNAAAVASDVCFAKTAADVAAASDNFRFNLGGCKDYRINTPKLAATPLISLAAGKRIVGSGDLAACLNVVKNIHDYEVDEMYTSTQKMQSYYMQWQTLTEALGHATAGGNGNKKWHVLINSGGLANSPVVKGHAPHAGGHLCTLAAMTHVQFAQCIDGVDNFDPYHNAAYTDYFPLPAGPVVPVKLAAAKAYFATINRAHNAFTTHALVKDLLTRMNLYAPANNAVAGNPAAGGHNLDFTIVFNDWTLAGSLMSAYTLEIPNNAIDTNVHTLYAGADAFGSSNEFEELADASLQAWYNRLGDWFRSWWA